MNEKSCSSPATFNLFSPVPRSCRSDCANLDWNKWQGDSKSFQEAAASKISLLLCIVGLSSFVMSSCPWLQLKVFSSHHRVSLGLPKEPFNSTLELVVKFLLYLNKQTWTTLQFDNFHIVLLQLYKQLLNLYSDPQYMLNLFFSQLQCSHCMHHIH